MQGQFTAAAAVARQHSALWLLLCREVGLLKINVERAEWDVLASIQPHHWPKVSSDIHATSNSIMLWMVTDSTAGP